MSDAQFKITGPKVSARVKAKDIVLLIALNMSAIVTLAYLATRTDSVAVMVALGALVVMAGRLSSRLPRSSNG